MQADTHEPGPSGHTLTVVIMRPDESPQPLRSSARSPAAFAGGSAVSTDVQEPVE